jgi:large subunit ribosomal protein L13
MRTLTVTPKDIEHRWFIIDADGMPLGRLATRVAQVIRGKHKPTFTPHMDTGDGVIVVNAAKVKLTGRKLEQKGYFSHSGYMGHDRITPVRAVLAARPERVVERAVFGMLPKTSLSKQVLRLKLRVYAGAEHPHAAQQPSPLAWYAPKTKRST